MQIHELNNFGGDVNVGAFMVVDDGSDTGKILVSSVTGPLNDRIDNIIAGGTAPSAAEVTDARLGADGFPYSSLGGSIRGQIEGVEGLVNPLLNVNRIDLDSIEHRGYYINVDGAIGSTAGHFAYSDPIPVEKGKTYTYTAWGTTIMSGICSSNSSGGSRSSVFVYSASDVYESFVYTPEADGYIVVCYNYDHFHALVEKDDITNIGEKINANTEGVANLNSEIEDISENKTNLIDMSQLILGKNWQNATAGNRAIVYVDIVPGETYYIESPENGALLNISCIQKTNVASAAALASVTVNKGATQTITAVANARVMTIQFNGGSADLTADDFVDYDPYMSKGDDKLTAVDEYARAQFYWKDKRLVWLGTSIPAAGKYDIDNPFSYPIMVGDKLGATVYNEAVGSSALHCKDPALISANNPYGFMPNFEAVSRCITNSLAEMEYIIQHYNDTNIFTQNVPASLSDSDKEFIRSCSWEIKLERYFNADDFPDAWIIDHGHNDIPSAASEATYTARTALSGTQVSGWYGNGSFNASTLSSHMEYDVTDVDEVYISGTIGQFYDLYDLFDSNGNNIGYYRNGAQQTYDGYFVDTRNAAKICVSNPNNLISTIEVKKYTYGSMYNSLYSYQGGLDFIVNKILTYNPQARIIMIGEYENQKYPTISENQEIAAKRWEFPLYKQWENLGWSQQPILVSGTYKTMLNIIIPDNLHPHSDTTGWALNLMADNIAAWLNTIR